jgi:hypothetical protein
MISFFSIRVIDLLICHAITIIYRYYVWQTEL